MSMDFDGRKDAIAIRWQQRDLKGDIMREGVTGAKTSWALDPKFGRQNVMKRVKSAMGLKWSVKTTKIKGSEGDIVRRMPDNSTLHIWIGDNSTDNIVSKLADMVQTGQLELDDVTAHAMASVDETTFDSVDWLDAVETELARRDLEI